MQSVLKLCVCMCVESFRTLGASQCATKSGKERNGRTDCSSFLHTNDLFKNLTLSLPFSLPRLSFGNCVSTQRQEGRGQVVSSLQLKDHPVLENISRVGHEGDAFVYFFENFERFAKKQLVVFYRVRWMMYGKFSFFFQILHTCTNEAKNFESGNKNRFIGGGFMYIHKYVNPRSHVEN